MSDDLEPWDPAVADILAEGRIEEEAPIDARARVARRLDLAVARVEVERAARPKRIVGRVAFAAVALAAGVAIGFVLRAPPRSIATAPSAASTTFVPHSEPMAALGDSTGRDLIDRAAALSMRGDDAGAIVALERHAQKYPKGPLTELREALYVHALAKAGQKSEARARGARFLASYPHSLFGPAVVDALARISDGSATESPIPR